MIAAPPALMPPPTAPAPRAAPGLAAVAPLAAAPLPSRESDQAIVVIPEVNTAIVGRGDNLWNISRRIYGRGVRYTVIYSANPGQIRNPNRIYPGQVFVLPGEESRDASR